jgi:hypothetical protein
MEATLYERGQKVCTFDFFIKVPASLQTDQFGEAGRKMYDPGGFKAYLPAEGPAWINRDADLEVKVKTGRFPILVEKMEDAGDGTWAVTAVWARAHPRGWPGDEVLTGKAPEFLERLQAEWAAAEKAEQAMFKRTRKP